MTPILKHVIGSLLVALPALALATAPVMASTSAKPRHHHTHKISYHKSHAKKTHAPTAS